MTASTNTDFNPDAGWIYLIRVGSIYKIGRTTDLKARLWDYVNGSHLNVTPLRWTRDIDNLAAHEKEIHDIVYPHVTRVKSLERGPLASRDTSEWFTLKDISETQLIEIFEEFQRKVFAEAGWTTPEHYFQLKCLRLWSNGDCPRACYALCGRGVGSCRLFHVAKLNALRTHLTHLQKGECYVDKDCGDGYTATASERTRAEIREHESWLEHDDKLAEQETENDPK